MKIESLFFPKLTCRTIYRTTRSGTYYKDYTKYRQEVREDCLGRCVYCDCHENELGRYESMNLDHFCPKGHAEFIHLENDPHNLVWSCRRCNGLKWHHWSALGMDVTVVDGRGFVDPFESERLECFSVADDGQLHALKPLADCIIELLGLNTFTPKNKRKQRLDAADQILQIDKFIKNLARDNGQPEHFIGMIETLMANRAFFKRMLDFELH